MRKNFTTIVFVAVLTLLVLGFTTSALAQYGSQPQPKQSGQSQMSQPGSEQTGQTGMEQPSTMKQGKHQKMGAAGAGNATMQADLLDEQKNAQEAAAVVEVNVSRLRLIDPSRTSGQPRAGEGHIHYQLDSGPAIASGDSRLEFHGLTPGEHTITVMLAGNDHTPLGPQQTLKVTIPEGAAAHR